MFTKKQIILTIVVFIIFMPVLVFAGTVQLPQTGQTKCYDSAGVEIVCSGTGQDREIRAWEFHGIHTWKDRGDKTKVRG